MPADGQQLYLPTHHTETPNMATQTATQQVTQSPTPILDEIRSRSGWTIFMGVLTAALGIVLIVYPFATAEATTVFVGSMLTLAGVAELVIALSSQTAGSFFVRFGLAALYGFTGVMLLVHPFEGAESLTLFVGAVLVVRAIVALIAAFKIRPLDGWGWFLADAIASGAAGGLILAKFPSSTSWAVGTIVGASVLVTGIARTAFAARIRQGVTNVRNTVRGNS